MRHITLKRKFTHQNEIFTVKATQDWTEYKSGEGGLGHYRAYIEDEKGNIVYTHLTMNGAPEEKLSRELLGEIFVSFTQYDFEDMKKRLREEENGKTRYVKMDMRSPGHIIWVDYFGKRVPKYTISKEKYDKLNVIEQVKWVEWEEK